MRAKDRINIDKYILIFAGSYVVLTYVWDNVPNIPPIKYTMGILLITAICSLITTRFFTRDNNRGYSHVEYVKLMILSVSIIVVRWAFFLYDLYSSNNSMESLHKEHSNYGIAIGFLIINVLHIGFQYLILYFSYSARLVKYFLRHNADVNK